MRIPKQLKINIKLALIFFKDVIKLNLFKFASKRTREIIYEHSISVSQEIKPGKNLQNKIFNLSLASKRINEYTLLPNEIFSFWRIIGNPNYGYKKSRTIKNGRLEEDAGGGICQVSGIVYNISVIAGLQILERSNHSIDIYTDETRFAPLGLDASVVFGYKDLRIKNNFPFPIKFEIQVYDHRIQIKLLSTQKITENKLVLEPKIERDHVLVKVTNEDKQLINMSKYKKNIA